MDNNFIKDNRVFPEEMHGSMHSEESSQKEKNHAMSVVWWILGLFVLLAIVFFVGLWTGKKTTEVLQQGDFDKENQIQQQVRQEAVDTQRAYRNNMTSEQRTDRLRNFFGE